MIYSEYINTPSFFRIEISYRISRMKYVSRKDRVISIEPCPTLIRLSYQLDAVTVTEPINRRIGAIERRRAGRKRRWRRLANFAWACRCHKALKYDVPAVDTLIATWNGSDERSV